MEVCCIGEDMNDKKMTILGLLSVLLGLIAGLFFGGYCLFIGGLEQAIGGASENPVNASAIAWGIGRVLTAAFTFSICTLLGFLGGIACFNSR